MRIRRRGDAYAKKLPKVKMDTSMEVKAHEGMLQQAEIIALYKLHRSDREQWAANGLAEQTWLNREDVASYLKYTRRYTWHETDDGVLPGFYDTKSKHRMYIYLLSLSSSYIDRFYIYIVRLQYHVSCIIESWKPASRIPGVPAEAEICARHRGKVKSFPKDDASKP